MSEKVLKRSEIRARLNVSKYRYAQLIDQGILPAPIKFGANSHPVHTETQLRIAEERLRLRSMPTIQTIKPLSAKQIAQIRGAKS